MTVGGLGLSKVSITVTSLVGSAFTGSSLYAFCVRPPTSPGHPRSTLLTNVSVYRTLQFSGGDVLDSGGGFGAYYRIVNSMRATITRITMTVAIRRFERP